MPDNDICPGCERAVQGNPLYCRICRKEMGGDHDNDGPPNGELPEPVKAPSIEDPHGKVNDNNVSLT